MYNSMSSHRIFQVGFLRRFRHAALFAALTLGLSGCASLNTSKTIAGAGYKGVLADEYQALADKAFREFDWIDAYKFNRKAQDARQGKAVLPDDPSTRKAGVADHQEILRAGSALKGYLEPRRLRVAPEDIARAQAAYDCWLEEGEESGRALTKGSCREKFYKAIQAADDKIIDDALDTIEAPENKDSGEGRSAGNPAPRKPAAGEKKNPEKTDAAPERSVPEWKRP